MKKLSFPIIFILIILIVFISNVDADDYPGFFLKVTKNVPRLGRRSDNSNFFKEKYFYKASKNVPQVGKRGLNVISSANNQNSDYDGADTDVGNEKLWLENIINPSKRIPGSNSNLIHLRKQEYSVIQPLNMNKIHELFLNDSFSTDDLKFVTWKDFDEALKNDNALYSKMLSLAKDANDVSHLKNIHNNLLSYFDSNNDSDDENDSLYYRID